MLNAEGPGCVGRAAAGPEEWVSPGLDLLVSSCSGFSDSGTGGQGRQHQAGLGSRWGGAAPSLHQPQDPRGRCEGRGVTCPLSAHPQAGQGPGQGTDGQQGHPVLGRALDPCWVSASWGPAGSSASFSGLCLTHSGALGGVRVLGSAGPTVLGQPGRRRGREASPRWKWLAGVICLLQWGGWGLVPSGSQGCVPLSREGRPFSWWPAHLLWAVFPSCSLTPARPGAQMNSQAKGVRRARAPARGVGVGSRAVLRSPGLCLVFRPCTGEPAVLPAGLTGVGSAGVPCGCHPGVLSELRKSGQGAQGQPGVLACDKVGWCWGELSVLKPSKDSERGRGAGGGLLGQGWYPCRRRGALVIAH